MAASANRKPVLIVDGYNLLRSGAAYEKDRDVADYESDPFNRAREHLIDDVAVYAQGRYEAIVVFDAAGNVFSEGEPRVVAGVKVIFTPAHVDADSTIERLAFEYRRDEREVLVLTSDWAVQNATFKDGVTRMSSAGFSQEIDEVRDEYQESAQNYSKNTLASRINPDVRAKLEAMVRKRGNA